MKVILHIGTHKTGTTALQEFCRVNSSALMNKGFYYAVPKHQSSANPIAEALVGGADDRVREFLEAHLRRARLKRAHTVIVSAEKFFGMLLLLRLHGKSINGDTITREAGLIRKLCGFLPVDVDPMVVCYVRRPDHYLESLYNQLVKDTSRYTGDVMQFQDRICDILHYSRYLNLWRDAFGARACCVYGYETVHSNVIEHFMGSVLGIDWVAGFERPGLRTNERISRDLLEYKRFINSIIPEEERDIEKRIFLVIDRMLKAPSQNHEYLSPNQRQELLCRLAESMDQLESEYHVPPFPAFDKQKALAAWKPYAGLPLQKRAEIERCYKIVHNRPKFLIERMLRRAAPMARRHVPLAGRLFDILRDYGVRQFIFMRLKK
jgi:hypothetical protein